MNEKNNFKDSLDIITIISQLCVSSFIYENRRIIGRTVYGSLSYTSILESHRYRKKYYFYLFMRLPRLNVLFWSVPCSDSTYKLRDYCICLILFLLRKRKSRNNITINCYVNFNSFNYNLTEACVKKICKYWYFDANKFL